MTSLFKRDIKTLRGVGEKRAPLYRKLGAPTVGDLLRLYPRAYEDWGHPLPIAGTELGQPAVVRASLVDNPREMRVRGGMTLYKVLVTDDEMDMELTFFNNRYIPLLLKTGKTYLFRGVVKGSLLSREMASPEFLEEDKAQDLLPVYPATQGLTSRMIRLSVEQALKLLPREISDPLPAPLREQYGLPSLREALIQIHFPQSEDSLALAKSRLVFEEFLVLQLGLLDIKSGRREKNLHALPEAFPEGYAALLPFSLTGAQRRAIAECIHDMAGPSPMNRLVQGDVGSGKTAVAAALCWAMVQKGYQAALMAPTEILAAQHYESLSALLGQAGVSCALFTGSLTAAQRRKQYAALESGEIQVAIGTHALISEKVAFHDLGLVVTDEQHRFGVSQRAALMHKGASPHLLVMSATPIPRTLALMAYGDLDISVLDELPPGRQEIATYLIQSPLRARAFAYVQKHLDQGRQGYLVCPLIEEGEDSGLMSIQQYSELVKKAFPLAKVGVLHGKCKNAEKERIMGDFAQGKTQLLVATTVVEVGVDVPNAAIMVIENAERYGLSQLHQLRGRIGRGAHKSTCILITDSKSHDTLERLRLFRDTRDGFQIAEADLKLRGPGDFFGQRQHGLPQLKIADMTEDMGLLVKARQCAQELFEAHVLDTPAYGPLRKEISRLFGDDTAVVL